ncbi:MepB family protein [Flavobacterium restrictum]|uniref:MepB family protein n=1 Tax=Flavobacterium restrictum TaxID=2594428 RepID=A0A553DVD1_9FLAO|nr:MepB family protein [Flavobacterium restrictum]TRX36699.1 MepB family protein [Flavobacterium restrictum]
MDSILTETKKILFDSCGFELSNVVVEKESSDYGAHRLGVNGLKIVLRQAKITPTKTGQFVTLWKRKTKKSPIEPFEISDDIDLFVINVKTKSNFGQFVFPKAVLVEKGIVSHKKEGKRAIRVYTIWDLVENKQAQKTQKWQLDYFLEIPITGILDSSRAKLLYSKNSINTQ